MTVEKVLAELSPRERVGQLNQRLLGWQAVERHGGSWRLSDVGKAEIERWSGLGAIYGLFRADAWSGRHWANGIKPEDRTEVVHLVQTAVVDANPAGIGALVVEEAPHGHQALGGTILPANLALAATWDVDLVREAAAAVAAELAASGVNLALVSGLDILRDARWGRSEETFGEDPELAAQMCRAIVEGMQGVARQRLGHDGVGVVMKHFAAQGEAVGGRNGQSAIIGPRDLAEIHLPPVVAAIQAGAVGLMAAYNDIDGVPCCANPWLLRTWLRDQQGFDGIVMADGLAVDQLLPAAGSLPAAGRMALLAGVDLSLWDEGFTHLADLAARDEAVAGAVAQACRRVLRLKQQLGLLPYRAPDSVAFTPERTEIISHRLAEEALVLLDGELPNLATLDAAGPILVVGPNATEITPFLGDYVAPLRQPPPGVLGTLRKSMAELPGSRPVVLGDPDAPDFASQVAGAAAVVAVLGGTSHRSYDDEFAATGAAASTAASCGEGVDVADLHLPGDQDELLRKIGAHTTGVPVVSVIVAGRPQLLTEVFANSTATLWAGYNGPHGPEAIVDALLGRITPTGRLPFTLLSATSVSPVRHNDRVSAVGVYRDAPEPVLAPFGVGDLGGCNLDDAAVRWSGDVVEVAVTLVNPTARGVSAVLPVTVHRGGGDVLPRLAELVAFRRVTVPAGEKVTVHWCFQPGQVFAEQREPVVLDHRQTTFYLAGQSIGQLSAVNRTVRLASD